MIILVQHFVQGGRIETDFRVFSAKAHFVPHFFSYERAQRMPRFQARLDVPRDEGKPKVISGPTATTLLGFIQSWLA